MTHPAPDITLDVDLRNPGQFFACCGVLELAGRLWPGSEGWFAHDGAATVFHVTTRSGEDGPLAEIVRLLCITEPLIKIPDGDAIAATVADDRKPVILVPFEMRLDWWLDAYGDGDKSELKVWAGQQTPERNINALRMAWREIATRFENSSSRSLFKHKWPMSGRFGFDPDASWQSQDVGFSPDEQGIGVNTSPATEILAAVGLQRCRPLKAPSARRSFIYCAWIDPVEIVVAPVAVAGGVRSHSMHLFSVNMRNAQFGNFGRAKIWEGEQ